VLLLVTLFMSFTGYLLPWDQLAFWAITVGTSLSCPPCWGGWWRFNGSRRSGCWQHDLSFDGDSQRDLHHPQALSS